MCCGAVFCHSAPAAEAPAGNLWSADPRLQDPAVVAAATTLAAGDAKKCIAQLRTAAMKNEHLPPPLLLLAYIQLANGRLLQALVALDMAAVEDKKHPEVYLTLGQIAVAQGRNTDAWVHLQKALKLKPPESWSQDYFIGFQVRCYQSLAIVEERRRDWEELQETLGLWSGHEPKNATLRDTWGRALLLSDRDEEALAQFTKAHELDPQLNPPELSMAAVHIERGEIDKAKIWYQKAIAAYPKDARVHFEYGIGLLMADDFAAARDELNQAATLDAAGMKLGVDLAVMQGYAARGNVDRDLAEQKFTVALKQSPGHATAMAQLVLVFVEQEGNTDSRDRARELATFLANKNADSPPALAVLGWVQYRQGNGDESEKTMLRAMTRPTNDPLTLYLIAQVLLERGKTTEASRAILALKDAIDRPTLFVERPQARKWLERISLAVP